MVVGIILAVLSCSFIVVFSSGTVSTLRSLGIDTLSTISVRAAEQISSRFEDIATLTNILRFGFQWFFKVMFSEMPALYPCSLQGLLLLRNLKRTTITGYFSMCRYGVSSEYSTVYCTLFDYGGSTVYFPAYNAVRVLFNSSTKLF